MECKETIVKVWLVARVVILFRMILDRSRVVRVVGFQQMCCAHNNSLGGIHDITKLNECIVSMMIAQSRPWWY